MRAAPAFQVSLHRFGVWRGAVGVLATCGLSVIAAWLMAHDRPIEPAMLAAAALACVGLVWLGVSLASVPAATLRWDGSSWQVCLAPSIAGAAVPGDLTVTLDLGFWMLLRFAPAASRAPYRTRWLPAQRGGHESQWHALRCAVHAPRPAPVAHTQAGS